MARQKVDVDLSTMQAIIDRRQINYVGPLLKFFDSCAEEYNTELKPATSVKGQLIYLRMTEGKINTTVKPNKSPKHIKKAESGYADIISIVDRLSSVTGIDYKVNVHEGNKYSLQWKEKSSSPMSPEHFKYWLLGYSTEAGAA